MCEINLEGIVVVLHGTGSLFNMKKHWVWDRLEAV